MIMSDRDDTPCIQLNHHNEEDHSQNNAQPSEKSVDPLSGSRILRQLQAVFTDVAEQQIRKQCEKAEHKNGEIH